MNETTDTDTDTDTLLAEIEAGRVRRRAKIADLNRAGTDLKVGRRDVDWVERVDYGVQLLVLARRGGLIDSRRSLIVTISDGGSVNVAPHPVVEHRFGERWEDECDRVRREVSRRIEEFRAVATPAKK